MRVAACSSTLGLQLQLLASHLRFTSERGHELVAFVHELFPLAASVGRADGIFAEERKRDRRIAVRHDRVGKDAGIDFAPAHRFRRRGARQPAPDHLIGGDLNAAGDS